MRADAELERLWMAWTRGDASVPLDRLSAELERHGRYERLRELEASLLVPQLEVSRWRVRRLGLSQGQRVRAYREAADGGLAVVRVGEAWVSWDPLSGTWGEDLEWFGAPPVDVRVWPGDRWVSLAFAPDVLRLVDRGSETEPRSIPLLLGASDTPYAVHPAGDVLVMSEGISIYRQSLPDGLFLGAVAVPGKAPLSALGFAGPGGELLVGAVPGALWLWSWQASGAAPVEIALEGVPWSLRRLAVSPDGRLACGVSEDAGRLVVVELHAPHRVAVLRPGGRIQAVATSPRGGVIVAATSHAELVRWRTESVLAGATLGQARRTAELARSAPPTQSGRYDWQGRELAGPRPGRAGEHERAPMSVPLGVAIHWHASPPRLSLAMDDGWLGILALGDEGSLR